MGWDPDCATVGGKSVGDLGGSAWTLVNNAVYFLRWLMTKASTCTVTGGAVSDGMVCQS